MIKGLGSGLGALVVAWVIGEMLVSAEWLLATMLLGFVALAIMLVGTRIASVRGEK